MKRSKLIFACIAIIIILSAFFAIRGFGLTNYLKVVVPILLILTIILTMVFMMKCLKWYTSYMMFSRKLFNIKVDRPRVYLNSLILPMLGIIIFILNYFQGFKIFDDKIINICIEVVYASTLITFYITLTMILYYVNSDKFESVYLPKVLNALEKYSEHYTTYYSPEQLNKIFDGLVEHSFLNYDSLDQKKEHKEKFTTLMISRKLPDYPFLKLTMDNLQTYVLYEMLSKEMKHFELNHMLNFFTNKNKKPTPESIMESYRKCVPNNIKERNKIELIFMKLS